MDLRARFEDFDEMLETLTDAVQARVRTAIPVRLTEDSDGHVVKLQPLIKGVQRMPDGSQKLVDLPVVSDVPIHHGGGGGVTVTHPHKKDDEGIFLVSDRGIDAWHQQGGVQPQIDARMHSLSDGFYLSNVRSTPRKLDKVSTESTQVRSDDGKHVMDLHPTKGITHSVENGKHVVNMDPTAGLKLLADAGKHVLTLHPQNGIGIETAKALALKAAGGTTMMGNFNVTGDIKASGKIGAPALSGLLSAFTGSIIGFLMCLATLMALSGAGDPSTAPQRASYTIASLLVR